MVCRDLNHALASFTEDSFSIFTGTPGPNRKIVLFAKNQFVKVGLNETSELLLINECKNLQGLESGRWVEIPCCMQLSSGVVALSDLGKRGTRKSEFTALHATALAELISQNPITSIQFSKTEIYHSSCLQLDKKEGISAHLIPKNLREKTEILAKQLGDKQLTFTWAHRDFTPWNCFVSGEKIMLYDFELAHVQLSFGFDAFHFVMQQGILVDRLAWNQLKPKLKMAFEILKTAVGTGNESFEDCINAYLLTNVAYHIDLYSNQAEWHAQINWLLSTWNDALSDMLNLPTEHRALLIGDVFDLLQNEKYAAIKFPNIQPQSLSEYADIDLLVNRNSAKKLTNFLANHSLVKTLQIQKQKQ